MTHVSHGSRWTGGLKEVSLLQVLELHAPGDRVAPRQRATAGRGRRRGHGRGQGRRAFAGAGEGRLRHGLRGHARRDGGEARRSIQY